jgi:hypothetical protein
MRTREFLGFAMLLQISLPIFTFEIHEIGHEERDVVAICVVCCTT